MTGLNRSRIRVKKGNIVSGLLRDCFCFCDISDAICDCERSVGLYLYNKSAVLIVKPMKEDVHPMGFEKPVLHWMGILNKLKNTRLGGQRNHLVASNTKVAFPRLTIFL